ncbi:NADP-dependent oxidoreductase [Roseomonas sp. SSH11]|uniref:NADP-dependent oxidoreductase n=1 Tax=Pararoseomonas baculiformis TaxID=2820812 RepID=A0ABS4A9L2_9PROT|nr:NADP-dependent oxidoreductase [Pararoseomonas baculiformis]MBP0443686.1 NADP-dependent oxidoreductase [Pararoseomonas baculiformis]
MTESNLRVLLRARPEGRVEPGHFEIREESPPSPRPGEALLRNRYLSLDPYMRGRMSAAKSYSAPVEIGAVMEGQCVAQVVEDPTGRFQPGDWVLGGQGWQRFSAVPAGNLRKLEPGLAPVTTALGVLGMPGTTAWVGVTEIAPPRPGETFVVSAASGAVGGVAGQIAMRMGARVVGIAGGAEKCAFVRDELGFPECVDHRAPDFAERLAAACPGGIDSYFENVGGAVQKAVFPLLNDFARVAFCGMVAEYNDPSPAPGPNLMQVVRKRLKLQGFIVRDHPRAFEVWPRTGAAWLREGSLRYREDVVRGLEKAPEAFIGLLAGKNFGKLVIEVT